MKQEKGTNRLLLGMAMVFIPLGAMLKDYGLFHTLAIILVLIVVYRRISSMKGGEN